ncbi:MAG: hypothetical protein IKJ07_00060 [Clostridia bacterium]|nr:hypothetical protein [Clostridia bacterium]
MKHNIRINGQVQELDCEIGTGICDKTGREIFEGDQVTDGKKVFSVELEGGDFNLVHDDNVISLDMYNGAVEVIARSDETPMFKDTRRAWSTQLLDAYNRLLDAFIECKSPEAVCEAARVVVKAAENDGRFEN